MPNVLTEGRRTGEYIVSEANGHRSREQVTVASGAGDLEPGTVLGQITASKKFVPYDPAAVDGSETAAAILYAGVDATDADARAVTTARDSEVNGHCLVWADGVDAAGEAAGITDLAAAGIIVR